MPLEPFTSPTTPFPGKAVRFLMSQSHEPVAGLLAAFLMIAGTIAWLACKIGDVLRKD
jgi:hypothetical protein